MSNSIPLSEVMIIKEMIEECDRELRIFSNDRTKTPGMKGCIKCAIKERRANLVERLSGRVICVDV